MCDTQDAVMTEGRDIIMTREGFTGVILAAGRGSRMLPLSDSYPKPILPICNKPLIQYQIEIIKSLGIEDIIVLVGHKGFEISKVLGDGSNLGVTIRYVEQMSMLGIAHAVGQLESHINKPFMLFLGDIFFIPSDLQEMFRLFAKQDGGAVLAMKEEHDPEAIRRNYAITLSPEGYVTGVVEKPRHTNNHLKGVGIYLFDLPIFDAIRRTPRTAMRDEYEITDAIQVLIDDGYSVRPACAVTDDINLTNPSDLLRCNLMQARVTPREKLTGRNVNVHQDARIENCVVGANVTIKHPIKIANSVIFDNTQVNSATNFENFIITPDRAIDCTYGMEFSLKSL